MEDPPRVTVVDPRAPGTHPELLVGGSDREPWRASPRQRRWISITVAAAVLVCAVVLGVDRWYADRAADRAAVTALRLWADSPPDEPEPPEGQVRLRVRNDGPSPLQLRSMRLNASGYGESRLDRVLRPGEYTVVVFSDTASCGGQLLGAPVDTVHVTLRTHRGTTTTRHVSLSPSAFRDVNYPARARCGYLPADEAFVFDVRGMRRLKQGAELDVRVANGSLLPLRLDRLVAGPGLAVAVEPPPRWELPIQDEPSTLTKRVALRVRLTVLDCEALALTSSTDRAFAVGQLMRAWLVRDSSIFEVPVPLEVPASERGVSGDAVLSLLLETCG